MNINIPILRTEPYACNFQRKRATHRSPLLILPSAMKTRLKILLLALVESALLALITHFSSSCSPAPASYYIDITSPQVGTTLTALTGIQGTYENETSTLTGIRLQLIRYSDGVAWTGTEWGGFGSPLLPVTYASDAWNSTGPMPSGANLPDGYYNIVVYADYSDHETVRADSVFAVGTTSPPVTPALYGWGSNLEGQLGAGAFASAANPVPVNMRGVLEGKIVAAVSSGHAHTLALTSDGRVYGWGNNANGELGTGPDTNDQTFAVPVSTATALAGKTIAAISAGYDHSLAADKDGLLFAWGANGEGQLGTGSAGADVRQALQVGGLLTGKKVVRLSAGSSFSLAVTSTGEVYAWGANIDGQLGNGTTTPSATPVLVGGALAGKFVTDVAAGASHAMALTSDGKVYVWGNGADGRLGNNSTTGSNTPVLVGGVLAGKVVTAISAGAAHSLVLAEDKVYAWGDATHGQVGTGFSSSTVNVLVPTLLSGGLSGKKVTRISAGSAFSFAATQDEKVFAWGSNSASELAGLSGDPVTIPTEADFSSELSGGRSVLGLDCGGEFGMVLTGFAPLPKPELVVEPVIGDVQAPIANGGIINYGTNAVGSYTWVYIVIRNTGNADLTDLSVTIDGPDQFDFFGSLMDSRLEPGGITGFYATFNPFALKSSLTATLHITSNDKERSPFNITLQGSSIQAGDLDPAFANPSINGTVAATALQADGKVVIGGSFTDVGGAPHNRLARLNADGTPDTGFTPDVNDTVNCVLVQPDGKIVIGGPFNLVNGVARNRIARLNENGTLDTAFNPNGDTGEVMSLALQADGKILVAGSFSDIGSSGRSRLVRLEPGGSVDSSFNPSVGGSSPVRCVVVQPDGMILIGGDFLTVGGNPHKRIARLDATGTVDDTFDGQVDDGSVLAIVPLRSGKPLLAGTFTSVAGTARNHIARLSVNGALETGFFEFDPNVNGTVNSMALQADGDIIIGGSFSTVYGQPRTNLARVTAAGQVDFNFFPSANDVVHSVCLQADGRIIAGGAFTSVGTTPRSHVARMKNTTALETLDIPDLSHVEWYFDGGFPELNQATFEVSSDGGTTWTPLGPASRTFWGTWTVGGLSLPQPGQIRARGFTQGGQNSGSSSVIETIMPYGGPPEINVTSTGGLVHPSGGTRDFGVATTGSGFVDVIFTIENTGTGPLTGLGSTFVTGADATSFKIVSPPAPTVPPLGTTSLTVRFSPRVERYRVAHLNIPSNDFDENPFDIELVGTGGIDTANWKKQNGIAGAPDTGDTDGDGVSELLENGLGTSPTTQNGDGTFISPPTGGSGFAPDGGFSSNDAPPSGGTFNFNYSRNKLALGDLVFQVEWSDTLASNDWHTTGVTETIVSDDGTTQQVQATVPAGAGGRRFARLKVTRP